MQVVGNSELVDRKGHCRNEPPRRLPREGRVLPAACSYFKPCLGFRMSTQPAGSHNGPVDAPPPPPPATGTLIRSPDFTLQGVSLGCQMMDVPEKHATAFLKALLLVSLFHGMHTGPSPLSAAGQSTCKASPHLYCSCGGGRDAAQGEGAGRLGFHLQPLTLTSNETVDKFFIISHCK